MSDETGGPRHAVRPIPPELFSAYHEGPFQRCSDCGASLEAPERST